MKAQGAYNHELSTSEDEDINSRLVSLEGEEDFEDEISSSDKDSDKENIENHTGESDMSSSSSEESATYEPGVS